ncbi:hypothetical protein MPTK1_2g10630 [Marchantia polymorpha subsp. ruderalis]|uniref:Secreted protein n=1 Tax=Marchantia polymorpha TaxID=3197 RepID=A0A2R6XCF5_MARPO|nr:hypothetical protein MARPO_0023s0031 [Marchantia polymorpha]BBN01836.1 hypothetical protein Mp_2g10630 [Marchantia polymorpha subsp. ruderalis]|eukprot:PTQ43699.1 hypothetical protein MARPO_0023s0031 [Marchantia polymorpha]
MTTTMHCNLVFPLLSVLVELQHKISAGYCKWDLNGDKSSMFQTCNTLSAFSFSTGNSKNKCRKRRPKDLPNCPVITFHEFKRLAFGRRKPMFLPSALSSTVKGPSPFQPNLQTSYNQSRATRINRRNVISSI